MRRHPPPSRPGRRRAGLPSLLFAAAALTALAASPAAADGLGRGGRGSIRRKVRHVVHIVVDGLRPDFMEGRPAFDEILSRGSCTLNARMDARSSQTLPNHVSMFTGLDVPDHGYAVDSDNGRASEARLADLENVFGLVKDAGGRTGFYGSKEKFEVFDRSWPIDRFRYAKKGGPLVQEFLRDMGEDPFSYVYLHLKAPDRAGHLGTGAADPSYRRAVAEAAGYVGEVLDLVKSVQELRDDTAIILTADHGFQDRGNHSDEGSSQVYKIPFCTWGPGVKPGADLARMNVLMDRGVVDPGRARGDRLGGIIRNSYSGVMAADWLGLTGDGPFGRQDVAVNEWDEQYVPGDSAHEWALGAPGAGPGSSSARPPAPALSTAAPSNPRPTARPTTAAPTLYPSRHPTFFLPDQLFLPDKKEQEPYLPTHNKQEFDACGRWWSRAVGCGADPGPGVAIGPCCSGFRCQEEVCIFDDLSNNWSGDYGGNLQDSIVGQFNNRAGGAPVPTSSDQISDTIQLYSTDIATLDEEFPSAGHDGGHLIAKHYDALVRFEIPYEVEGNEIVSSVLELQRYDSSEGFLVTVHRVEDAVSDELASLTWNSAPGSGDAVGSVEGTEQTGEGDIVSIDLNGINIVEGYTLLRMAIVDGDHWPFLSVGPMARLSITYSLL